MSENLPGRRRQLILERVRAAGAAKVADLAAEFGVSDMTVRRDLNQLVKDGELHKVHGGAELQPGSSADEPGFHSKSALQLPEKADHCNGGGQAG
ncbi:DeoR family transcriptional regulator [Glutamicibacter halophytocola]|uniref:DeoR family transcriptional regulator n=1 Tax=Glutamicibacter halophytocola TaxID=1933880 RepID=UPI00321903E4